VSARCDEGKTRYATHAQATKTAILMAWRRWERRSTPRKLAHRVYSCQFGDHWHLTSQAKRGDVKPIPVRIAPRVARPALPSIAEALDALPPK